MMTSKVCEIKYIPRTVSDTKNLIDYLNESTKRMNEWNEWNVLLDVYDTNIW